MISIVWFELVTKRDAQLLVRWWNAHTPGYFERDRSRVNARFWRILKVR